MKFQVERIDMLENQLTAAGMDFTPDYYKRLEIDVTIAEERIAYRSKEHANNV